MKNIMPTLLMLLISFSILFAQVHLNEGLVGYYKMDEGGGEITTNSAQGSNLAPDGILMNHPVWIEGMFGSALWFEPSEQSYVDLGDFDPSAGTNTLSISVWINWEGLDGNSHGICGKRDGWDPPDIMWSMVLDANSGGIQFETNTDDGKVLIITPEPPPVTDWLHVVLTFDGSWAKFYFNGSMVVEGAMQFGQKRDANFQFGCGEMGGNLTFRGALDELRFYNRVLNEQEITALAEWNPTGANEKTSTMIKDYILGQNYPNPFNPITSVPYELVKPGHVTLTIYNALAQEVSTLVNTIQSKGRYVITFDAGKLPAGIYFYELKCENQIIGTKKMLLIK